MLNLLAGDFRYALRVFRRAPTSVPRCVVIRRNRPLNDSTSGFRMHGDPDRDMRRTCGRRDWRHTTPMRAGTSAVRRSPTATDGGWIRIVRVFVPAATDRLHMCTHARTRSTPSYAGITVTGMAIQRWMHPPERPTADTRKRPSARSCRSSAKKSFSWTEREILKMQVGDRTSPQLVVAS